MSEERVRMQKRLERKLARMVDVMFDSPKLAAEWEATGQISSEFPPSRYALGPMTKIRQPDVYVLTHTCTQQQLRDAEAIAFGDQQPWRAGLIGFYRHAQFGADHRDGYLGELFGGLVR